MPFHIGAKEGQKIFNKKGGGGNITPSFLISHTSGKTSPWGSSLWNSLVFPWYDCEQIAAMDCEEKTRLVEAHHKAALEYSKAARKLNASRVTDATHDQRRTTAKEARGRA